MERVMNDRNRNASDAKDHDVEQERRGLQDGYSTTEHRVRVSYSNDSLKAGERGFAGNSYKEKGKFDMAGNITSVFSDQAGGVSRSTLRVLAGAAVALILLAWLGALAAEPDLFRANVIRVLGALVAAGIAWATHRPAGGRSQGKLPWQRCLSAGVVGSLAVTGVSMLAPALGGFTFAGWLASGIAGGAMVVLAGYALTGRAVPTEGRD